MIAYPFNFYVFPRGYKTINPIISLQTSTIEFNSKNGMDWNKWIRDGNNILIQESLMCKLTKLSKLHQFHRKHH